LSSAGRSYCRPAYRESATASLRFRLVATPFVRGRGRRVHASGSCPPPRSHQLVGEDHASARRRDDLVIGLGTGTRNETSNSLPRSPHQASPRSLIANPRNAKTPGFHRGFRRWANVLPKEVRLCKRAARWTGLEPAASGVTGRRYNRLNYHRSYSTVKHGADVKSERRRTLAGYGAFTCRLSSAVDGTRTRGLRRDRPAL
jgi:hypothetical protein